MRTTFFHVADVHLGNHQYQLDARYDDFAKAFLGIIEDAIRQKVAFVLVAGDVFHKRAIDAQTLYQANAAFRRLHDAGIPALVIEGNHDKAYYSDGSISWLSYLKWTNALILLGPTYRENALHFAPWSPAQLEGGMYDIPGGVRIYGIPWAGSQTGRIIQWAAEELQHIRAEEEAAGVRYRILMLHTGVEGIVPTLHGLPARAQFDPLHGLVDYIALGHVHKSYVLDDWIYNPGSTETVSAEESAWERGYFAVTVDPDATPRHQAQHVINPKRPFIRRTFQVEGLTTPAELLAHFTTFCERLQRDVKRDSEEPVVDIALRGTLAFDQSALDKKALEEIIGASVQPRPLHILLRNQTNAFDAIHLQDEFDRRDRATWKGLEQQIFRGLFLRDSRYAPDAEEWARVLADLKEHALQGDEPAAIAAWLDEMRMRLSGAASNDPPN